MKTDTITALTIVPEEYDTIHADKIDYSNLNSEMTKQERRFVNGLIRWYKPEELLEIGVSRGGGTVNLLNAISDMPSAKLTGIDRLDFFWGDGVTPVGANAVQIFPDLPQGKWNLITGKDPSEVMETLNTKFDFVVIDTAHLHPVESLNFLCVLPYLKDGSVLVIHDTFLHVRELDDSPSGERLGARILMSSLVGEKLLPKYKTTSFIPDAEPVSNIVAIQITTDTRKYICNVFESLALPWEMFPAEDIKNVRNLLLKHYLPVQMDAFDEAVRLYAAWIISQKSTFSLERISQPLRDSQSKNMMFYGAGQNMEKLLAIYDTCNLPFHYPIWDINAKKISQLKGHKVFLPDFDTKVPSGSTAVITTTDLLITDSVQEKLENVGWTVIRGLNRFLKTGTRGDVVLPFPVELTDEEKNLITYVKSHYLSMVYDERLFATVMSCKYVIENNIEGDFVESGVWRDGNAILAAGIFKLYGSDRKIWLYDTFEGFVGITLTDKDLIEQKALENAQKNLYDSTTCGNSLEDVKRNFERYGLLDEKIIFVEGNVMNTLESDNLPEKIAVLRLDTDLYESSKKELEVLYPKLTLGGVLMLDDYGYHTGTRRAVDEYFKTTAKPFLQYIDCGGRIGIKTI